MPCRLIVNADDFGVSPGVNEAVVRLHDEGIVTSTSLMVGEPAAAEAAALARERPRLAVGLHAVLVYGRPVLPPEQVPHLVEGKDGFPRDCVGPGLRFTFSRQARVEMRAELTAQFLAFRATGLPLSHVDGHLHFHLTPAVGGILLELCREFRPLGFRVPEDDRELYRRMDPADARRQAGQARWFAFISPALRRGARREGLVTTRWCYGFFRTGRLDAAYLVRLIWEMPDADLELHCHPDLSTDSGRREFEALRSPLVREALAGRGVELCRYEDLAGERR